MNSISKPKCCRDVNCKRAGEKLKPSEFPRNARARDGLHSYCRVCNQRRTNESRAKSRPARQDQKVDAEIARKPMVVAEVVEQAIWKGARTREQIESVTQLPMDDICDALAVLKFDHGVIASQEIRGEARFYPVRAA